jgi:hypothetical protein
MKKKKLLPVKTPDPLKDLRDLAAQLANNKDDNPDDIERLHRQLLTTPNGMSIAYRGMKSMRYQLIEMVSFGKHQAYMKAEVDKLGQKLGYADAPALEQLLIDHILTVQLRLLNAEFSYNQRVINQSITFKSGEYWDNLLTTTQARFLRAIEALARVRRLARNTPALQINIANDGGKQVNVAGDVHGSNSQPLTDSNPEPTPCRNIATG